MWGHSPFEMKTGITRNTILNLIGSGFPILVNILSIPLTLSYLGDVEFAILTIVWLIIGSSTFFDFGMGRATTKFISEAIGRNEHERIPAILGSAISTQFVFGSIGAALVIAVSGYLATNTFEVPVGYEDITAGSLAIAGIGIPLVLVTTSFRGLLEALHRFEVTNTLKVIFSTLTYIAPLIGYLMDWGLIGIVQLTILFRFLQLLLFYITCKIIMPSIGFFPRLHWAQAKKMYSFGGWVALSGFISPIQENMERLILASMMPISLLTYYSIPKDMLERLLIIPSSITAAIFPTFSMIAAKESADVTRIFATSAKIVLIVLSIIITPLLIVADPIIAFWIDAEFAFKSTPVVKILALGILASSLNLLAMTLFQSLGRPDITAKQQLIRLPIIGCVAWVLVGEYGLVGAAYSWSFGRILALVMNWLSIIFIVGVEPRSLFTRGTLLSVLILVGVQLVFLTGTLQAVIPAAMPLAVQPILSFMILVSLYWRFGLSDLEKKGITSRFSRMFKI